MGMLIVELAHQEAVRDDALGPLGSSFCRRGDDGLQSR